MHVYIVTKKPEEYHKLYEIGSVDSFVRKSDALRHVIDLCGGNISIGGTGIRFKLDEIVRLNVKTNEAVDLRVTVEEGLFVLRPALNEPLL